MQWWNDFVEWFYSDDGWRVLSGAIIPALAIIVAGVIAALIGRGSTKRLISMHDRETRTAAVSAMIGAARRAARWNALSVAEQQQADHVALEADARLRLLPVSGAALAADWAAHEIVEMKKNAVSFSFQAEQSLIEFRTRLVEWQARPSRARKLFKNDLDSWAYEASLSDQELVAQQQAWAAQQAAAAEASAAASAPPSTPSPAVASTSASVSASSPVSAPAPTTASAPAAASAPAFTPAAASGAPASDTSASRLERPTPPVSTPSTAIPVGSSGIAAAAPASPAAPAESGVGSSDSATVSSPATASQPTFHSPTTASQPTTGQTAATPLVEPPAPEPATSSTAVPLHPTPVASPDEPADDAPPFSPPVTANTVRQRIAPPEDDDRF